MRFLRLVSAALLVSVTGCTLAPGKSCKTNDDCTGGTCDVSLGICVTEDPAGGGSAGGGGGGSAAGGGSAGGAGGGSADDGGTDAGDDGGIDAGPYDAGVLCQNVSCTFATVCVEQGDAGVCLARYSRLAWESPAEGGATNGMPANLRASLTAVRQPNDPPQLPYTFAQVLPDGGTGDGGAAVLTRLDAGYYGDALTVGDGRWQVTLSWPDAGLDAGTRRFVIDRDPPAVTVQLASPPTRTAAQVDPQAPGAWKRDERVRVQVSGPADLDPSSITVTAPGLDGGPLRAALVDDAVCADAGLACAAPGCGCVEVDLARVALPMAAGTLRGEVPLAFEVRDLAGNKADAGPTITPDGGPLTVTRLRFALQLPSPGTRGTPAIGRGGTLFLGHNTGVSAISPAGAVVWTSPVGAVTAPVAVGPADAGVEYVFAVVRSPGSLFALNGATGAKVGDGCEGHTNAISELAPTVSRVGNVVTGSTMIADYVLFTGLLGNAVGSSLVAYQPSTPACRSNLVGSNGVGSVTAASVTYEPPNANGAPATAVQRGTQLLYPVGNTIASFSYDTTNNVWNQGDTGYPVSTMAGALGPLAINNRTGGWSMLASGAAGLARIDDNRMPQWKFPSTTIPAHAASIKGENETFVALSSAPPSVARVNQNGTPLTQPMTNLQVRNAMVLANDGRIYAAAANGTVIAFRPGLLEEWRATLGQSVQLEASPTLDCNRLSAGSGRPAVLYFVGTDGVLFATLVDSTGLDLSADWPKHQHDPRNTGVLDTPMSEFACP